MRLGLALLASLVLFLPLKAAAFTITPLRQVITIDPGKEQIVGVTVQNTEKTPITFTARIGGVKQDEQGRPIFEDHSDEAENWFTPKETLITVRSGQQKKIFFTLKPPLGTEPGTHAAAILVREEGNQLTSQAASLLLITVAGLVHESVQIEHFALTPSLLITNKHVTTSITIKNQGTVQTPLTGFLQLKPVYGSGTYETNLSLGNNVLPGAVRQSHIALKDMRLAPGMYQAELFITYGLTGATARAVQTFWYIPWWSFVAVVLVVSLLGYIIRRLFKK